MQPYRHFRDWIMVSALFFTAVVTPVEVSFMGSASEHVSSLWVMNRIIDCIFMTDIFITFNLAYQVHHTHGHFCLVLQLFTFLFFALCCHLACRLNSIVEVIGFSTRE